MEQLYQVCAMGHCYCIYCFSIYGNIFTLINLNENINVYIPKNIDACWATKTPCVGGVNYLDVKKVFGFNVFLKKK